MRPGSQHTHTHTHTHTATVESVTPATRPPQATSRTSSVSWFSSYCSILRLSSVVRTKERKLTGVGPLFSTSTVACILSLKFRDPNLSSFKSAPPSSRTWKYRRGVDLSEDRRGGMAGLPARRAERQGMNYRLRRQHGEWTGSQGRVRRWDGACVPWGEKFSA